MRNNGAEEEARNEQSQAKKRRTRSSVGTSQAARYVETEDDEQDVDEEEDDDEEEEEQDEEDGEHDPESDFQVSEEEEADSDEENVRPVRSRALSGVRRAVIDDEEDETESGEVEVGQILSVSHSFAELHSCSFRSVSVLRLSSQPTPVEESLHSNLVLSHPKNNLFDQSSLRFRTTSISRLFHAIAHHNLSSRSLSNDLKLEEDCRQWSIVGFGTANTLSIAIISV